MDRPPWAPAEVDFTRPAVARVCDWYRGGSHHVESDRAFGRRVVDQFLDLGSGIPTVGNVHEVAHAGNPDARIVAVLALLVLHFVPDEVPDEVPDVPDDHPVLAGSARRD